MPQITVQRGLQAQNASANPYTVSGDYFGSAQVSEALPRYHLLTRGGLHFSASNQSVATTTVGLATTYTGLCISNPITSSVNAVLTKASVMQSVIQAVQPEAFAIAIGYNATTAVTHTAALAVKSNYVGVGAVGIVVADTSATLPTAPTYHTFAANTGSATTNGTGTVIDLEGSIILPPGGYACWVTPAQASVAGMWFSFNWIEVPIAG